MVDHGKCELLVESSLEVSLGSTLPWPLPIIPSLCFLRNMILFRQPHLGSVAIVLQTVS